MVRNRTKRRTTNTPEVAQASSGNPQPVEQERLAAIPQVEQPFTLELAEAFVAAFADDAREIITSLQQHFQLTALVVRPQDYMTWQNGQPFVRGHADKAIPIAFALPDDELGEHPPLPMPMPIYVSCETGQVFIEQDMIDGSF